MRSFLRLARVRRQGGSHPYTMRLCVSGTQEFFVSCVQVAVIRPRLAGGRQFNETLILSNVLTLCCGESGGFDVIGRLSPTTWLLV